MHEEFQEIAHSGGKITFKTRTLNGHFGYQTHIQGNRPVPTVWIALYALTEGIPVQAIHVGQPNTPLPGCLEVYIASDSEGRFGHNCPHCKGYWRSGPWPRVCPYCGQEAKSHQFLSDAQRRYVKQYCDILTDALSSEQDVEVVVDMDAVADAVGQTGEKPPFYVSEKSQQHKFTCPQCDEFNDNLGRFGYCSLCGTRNDLKLFEGEIIQAIRDRVKAGSPPEDAVRDSVAAFDSLLGQYAKQLVAHVPMTERRKTRLTKQRFHDFEEVRSVFANWFDIDICTGMDRVECHFVSKMFHRRHVYEHNGGEVDQRYLDQSGDTTVKLKQHIRETPEDAHLLLGSLVKMARSTHNGFHELITPIEDPIKALRERQAWKKKHGG